MEAGPSAPPEDEDYGPDIPDDDDEGRFFGGGVTREENEILDYMDGQQPAEIAP
jgi:beta-catenin-like protein 1